MVLTRNERFDACQLIKSTTMSSKGIQRGRQNQDYNEDFRGSTIQIQMVKTEAFPNTYIRMPKINSIEIILFIS